MKRTTVLAALLSVLAMIGGIVSADMRIVLSIGLAAVTWAILSLHEK